jgi:hypothetical protein
MRSEYRRYDWRLRNLVAESKNIHLFPELNIPLSTKRDWIKKGPIRVLTLPEFQMSDVTLVEEVSSLKRRILELETVSTLVGRTIKLFGFQIQYMRLPSGLSKKDVLDAIASAVKFVPLQTCLDAVGMSLTRFRHWTRRQILCRLEDQPSCPRGVPVRLTVSEILAIKTLVKSPDHAHYSVLSLSLLAKRLGLVFASPSTWGRVIREYGLKRTRNREYPPKPKVEIRASAPNQIWHLDTLLIPTSPDPLHSHLLSSTSGRRVNACSLSHRQV